MKKKIAIVIACLILIATVTICCILFKDDEYEIRAVNSEAELEKLYKGDRTPEKNIAFEIFTLPYSLLYLASNNIYYDGSISIANDFRTNEALSIDTAQSAINTEKSVSATEVKDFSTTNIQVENVDEADITKTDGDYIYSISESDVIITDVRNPKEIKIAAKIQSETGVIPEDLILYKNELVVIYAKSTSTSYYYNSDTIVKVYNITSREKPVLLKTYEIDKPYYTSRCINNMLYVISSGHLEKDGDKIKRSYTEDGRKQEIALDNIKYLKDVKTNSQTTIATLDLNNATSDVNVSSYLLNISNAYVSENSIYLLEQKYEYNHRGSVPPISSLFGLGGAIGPFIYENENQKTTYGYYTKIIKFDIQNDGNVTYSAKTEIKGKTINQYSLDELNGHLRVALFDNEGARVVTFDEKLNQLGASDYVAKGETMYSSRFMGNKAYLVTYRTMDPLFVIDLKDEAKPRVLGELHIPGYSTYLHPYDENHLIGIGMQTEEVVRRNSLGQVISTTASVVGMKMALFDVTDVNNPVQMSETIIGDRRTTSAILTNPKALLFSRERELIAIPVNNYSEDVEMGTDSTSYSASISQYTNYSKPYIGEGYFVYRINLKDGFKLRGTITHEKETTYKYYYTNSKLLRGMYIDENLYTVSETAIKVNKLETLEPVSELKIKE